MEYKIGKLVEMRVEVETFVEHFVAHFFALWEKISAWIFVLSMERGRTITAARDDFRNWCKQPNSRFSPERDYTLIKSVSRLSEEWQNIYIWNSVHLLEEKKCSSYTYVISTHLSIERQAFLRICNFSHALLSCTNHEIVTLTWSTHSTKTRNQISHFFVLELSFSTNLLVCRQTFPWWWWSSRLAVCKVLKCPTKLQSNSREKNVSINEWKILILFLSCHAHCEWRSHRLLLRVSSSLFDAIEKLLSV